MFEEKLLEPHFTSVLAPYMLDVVEQKRALGNKYNAGVEAVSYTHLTLPTNSRV